MLSLGEGIGGGDFGYFVIFISWVNLEMIVFSFRRAGVAERRIMVFCFRVFEKNGILNRSRSDRCVFAEVFV